MIPTDVILLFVTASVALAFAPGPDNIFVLTQSALYGRKTGLLVTLGLCTGLLVHTSAVALGVAAIFQSSLLAFSLLKLAGALYLLYLAVQAFRASAAALETNGSEELSWRGLYTRGIFMNITNPKVAIFFLALLPQFADPARGAITVQMLLLVGLFIVSQRRTSRLLPINRSDTCRAAKRCQPAACRFTLTGFARFLVLFPTGAHSGRAAPWCRS